MQLNPPLSDERIKRYFFLEMTDDERSHFEQELFDDDALFFAVADQENELVDRYVAKTLSNDEIGRFERSVRELPARSEKAANSISLQSFIAEERPPMENPLPVVEKRSFWANARNFLTIRPLAFTYTAGILVVLLSLSTIFLVLDNRRKSGEIAQLQNDQQQQELERQLELERNHVNELQSQAENQSNMSDRLASEIETTTQEKNRIEAELNRLQHITPKETPSAVPTVATFLLMPSWSTRDGRVLGERNLSVEKGTKHITLWLFLPSDTKDGEKLSARLNDKLIARDLVARQPGSGQKRVQVTISVEDIRAGSNQLMVSDATGAEVSRYVFNMKRK